jgi:hypothetical protein
LAIGVGEEKDVHQTKEYMDAYSDVICEQVRQILLKVDPYNLVYAKTQVYQELWGLVVT